MARLPYIGSELDLFQDAVNWRRYWCQLVRPFVVGDVLEVGAGLGSVTKCLIQGTSSWTALEPDPDLASQMQARIAAPKKAEAITTYPRLLKYSNASVINGTLADIDKNQRFHTIIYADVLEHIENDASEVQLAFEKLCSNGHLIILAPAHQALYSEFDNAIGHFRRYNKKALEQMRPGDSEIKTSLYLDSVGMTLSMGNKFLLHSEKPSYGQIWLWDKLIIPLSKRIDKLLNYQYGKSVLMVWQKTARTQG